MSDHRPRVLLLAEQANPEFVSVPLLGWSHGRALAEVADVHLVTQVRNRQAILRAGLIEGQDFTSIDSEKVAARIHAVSERLRGGAGKGWTTVMAFNSISYKYFEKLVWKKFGPAIKRGDYDLVHRLTPVSPTLPSSIAKRCRKAGVPFIFGPINGGVPWPAAFESARRAEKEWLSYVRGLVQYLPGFRATRKYANAIIVASQATLEQTPAVYRDKCFYIPENAVDPERFNVSRQRQLNPGDPVRLVFIGRLVPLKGVDMLLEAAADLVRGGSIQITILGDGPEKEKLESIIERENLRDGVDLAGWVEHSELQHRLVEHDVLAFPSIREFGGGVVLEAMAVGLVPMVMHYGGPGELVTPSTGYRIPMSTRSDIVVAFRDHLEKIVAQPSVLDPMSQAAQLRVQELFTWSAKAAQVRRVYDWVVNPDSPRPVFPEPGVDYDSPDRETAVASPVGSLQEAR